MKYLYSVLFCVLALVDSYSQSCKSFDDRKFFSTIRFGTPIPNDLAACSRYPVVRHLSGTLRIQYDSLSQSCKKKHVSDFMFMSMPFSFLQLGVNRKGLLYSVELYSFFDDARISGSASYDPPDNFKRLAKEMESFFGKPREIQGPTRQDSMFIKELGMPLAFNWECNDITLRLRVVYGAGNKDLNVLDLQITNRGFDRPEVERELH